MNDRQQDTLFGDGTLVEVSAGTDAMRSRQIERLRYYKQRLDLTYREIAERSGVPESTVKKIITGATKNPRMKNIRDIERALGIREVLQTCADESGGLTASAIGSKGSEAYVDGTGAVSDDISYERANGGGKTLDDYYSLPDNVRAELIDGVLYDMSAPSLTHQAIITELLFQIQTFIHTNHGKCMVFPAPTDVQLDRDDKTMLQPDIMVVCDRDKLKGGAVFGAPDFIIEILSPATRFKDMTLKLWKYMNSGVREYWIIDPDKHDIAVYFFEEDMQPVHFTFEDQVPVRIYCGNLKLSFSQIISELEQL